MIFLHDLFMSFIVASVSSVPVAAEIDVLSGRVDVNSIGEYSLLFCCFLITYEHSSVAWHAHDGRFGSEFPSLGLFVTTPNMDVVYTPIDRCETRMRVNNDFGKDDPNYWPQPFQIAIGHLAAIPNPVFEDDHPLALCWYAPEDHDFHHVETPGLTGIVRLAPDLQDSLVTLSSWLRTKLSTVPQEDLKDLYLSRGRDQLRKYVTRLSEPGTRNMVSLQLACLQRVFLETYARIDWVVRWLPRLKDVDHAYPLDARVMGAFTGSLDVAADLFRVGIPVWVVRPFHDRYKARIDALIPPLNEDFFLTLPIRGSDLRIDSRDAVPPHPVIYTGLPGRHKRYVRMSLFVHQQFSSSLVGDFEDVGQPHRPPFSAVVSHLSAQPSGYIGAAKSGSATAQAFKTPELDDLDVTSCEVWVPANPPRKKSALLFFSFIFLLKIFILAKSSERNRFQRLDHAHFPLRLPWWDTACERLLKLHDHTGHSLLHSPVPNPVIFLLPDNQLRSNFLLTWLRLRPVVLWRLSLPNARFYASKDWRAMLEAADGYKTAASDRRTKMLAELNKLVDTSRSMLSSQMTINPANLQSSPALWNDVPVELDASGQLNGEVIREVIWELYETNFRIELLTLDRHMVPEPVGDTEEVCMQREVWFQREAMVHRCWPGLPYRPQYHSPGASSVAHQALRLPFIKAFFELLRTWPGRPDVLKRPFPPDEHLSDIFGIEEALANFYVRVFVKVFHRPATVPHIALGGPSSLAAPLS